MTTAMQIRETARDRADFRRCFKTGAAVFLHDDGSDTHSTYGNTLESGLHASANDLRHARLQAFRPRTNHLPSTPIDRPSKSPLACPKGARNGHPTTCVGSI